MYITEVVFMSSKFFGALFKYFGDYWNKYYDNIIMYTYKYLILWDIYI